jgi:hypothetical protein
LVAGLVMSEISPVVAAGAAGVALVCVVVLARVAAAEAGEAGLVSRARTGGAALFGSEADFDVTFSAFVGRGATDFIGTGAADFIGTGAADFVGTGAAGFVGRGDAGFVGAGAADFIGTGAADCVGTGADAFAVTGAGAGLGLAAVAGSTGLWAGALAILVCAGVTDSALAGGTTDDAPALTTADLPGPCFAGPWAKPGLKVLTAIPGPPELRRQPLAFRGAASALGTSLTRRLCCTATRSPLGCLCGACQMKTAIFVCMWRGKTLNISLEHCWTCCRKVDRKLILWIQSSFLVRKVIAG